MQFYKKMKTVEAMQWLPDDPGARQAFLDELQKISDEVTKHGGYPVTIDVDEEGHCNMSYCRAMSRCTRTPAGTAWIYYDLTKDVYLEPGWWLVRDWPKKEWLYAKTDESFRSEYWPMKGAVKWQLDENGLPLS